MCKKSFLLLIISSYSSYAYETKAMPAVKIITPVDMQASLCDFIILDISTKLAKDRQILDKCHVFSEICFSAIIHLPLKRERIMVSSASPTKLQLQQACKLSGATWAAWLFYSQTTLVREKNPVLWDMVESYGLNHKQTQQLENFINNQAQSKWLSGALASGRIRWQNSEQSSELNCKRVCIFPNSSACQILIIGGEKLDSAGENLFRLLALHSPPAPKQQLVQINKDIEALLEISTHIVNGARLPEILSEIVELAYSYSGSEIVHLSLDNKPSSGPDQSIYSVFYPTQEAVEQQGLNHSQDRNSKPQLSFNLQTERQPTLIVAVPGEEGLNQKTIGRLSFFTSKPGQIFPRPKVAFLEILALLTSLAVKIADLKHDLMVTSEDQLSIKSRLLRSLHLAALGEVSAQVANDLNNPLTTIILSLEIAKSRLISVSENEGKEFTSAVENVSLALEQALRTRSIVWALNKNARETRPLNQAGNVDQISLELAKRLQNIQYEPNDEE